MIEKIVYAITYCTPQSTYREYYDTYRDAKQQAKNYPNYKVSEIEKVIICKDEE